MNNKDSVLDEILSGQDEIFSAVEEAQILKPLEKEIEMIIDSNIKSFVKSSLTFQSGITIILSIKSIEAVVADESITISRFSLANNFPKRDLV